MDKIIVSAAHFKLCRECRMHGCVVSASGQEGPEVSSQEDALFSLKRGVELGFIAEDEVGMVKWQIGVSKLPLHTSEADPLVEAVADFKNFVSIARDISKSKPSRKHLRKLARELRKRGRKDWGNLVPNQNPGTVH